MSSSSPLGSLLLLLVLVGVFWLVAVRPAKKRQAAQAALVASLQVGSQIVTTSGLHAKVLELDDDSMKLEIAPGVVVTWARAAVLTVLS